MPTRSSGCSGRPSRPNQSAALQRSSHRRQNQLAHICPAQPDEQTSLTKEKEGNREAASARVNTPESAALPGSDWTYFAGWFLPQRQKSPDRLGFNRQEVSACVQLQLLCQPETNGSLSSRRAARSRGHAGTLGQICDAERAINDSGTLA